MHTGNVGLAVIVGQTSAYMNITPTRWLLCTMWARGHDNPTGYFLLQLFSFSSRVMSGHLWPFAFRLSSMSPPRGIPAIPALEKGGNHVLVTCNYFQVPTHILLESIRVQRRTVLFTLLE